MRVAGVWEVLLWSFLKDSYEFIFFKIVMRVEELVFMQVFLLKGVEGCEIWLEE